MEIADLPRGLPLYADGEDLLADFLARPIRTSLRLHRAAGPVCRAVFGGQEVVVVSGREANLFVWRNAYAWDYARSNAAFAEEIGDDHLDAASGPRHRRRRQVMNPAFSAATVLRTLPLLADRLAAEVPPAAAAGPVDFLRFWMRLLTRHRAATSLVVGLDDEQVRDITDWQYRFIYGITLPYEARRRYYSEPGYRRIHGRSLETFRRIARARIADPAAHDDELAAILARRADLPEGDGLPTMEEDAVLDDVYLLLVAGVDNVQTHATDILRAGLADPALSGKLRAELDGWDGRDPLAVAHSRWWQATSTEIHRLRPQVPATTATLLYPTADLEFDGVRIAAGTPVLHPMVVTHVMEEYYPEPFAFRPERFLDGTEKAPGTFAAFGGGPHLCIGRNAGSLEGMMLAAHLLVNYDVEGLSLPDSDHPVGDRPSQHLATLPVTLVPRR